MTSRNQTPRPEPIQPEAIVRKGAFRPGFEGDGAVYLPQGVVATGSGEFGGTRGEQFRCADAGFTRSVRPLDMLVVQAEIEDGPNFLVRRVADDETLELRRWPKELPGMVRFEVRRTSGLRAVPGGCCLEVTEGSHWRTRLAVAPGEYRLGFFYRAFDPARMSATALPAVRPVVSVAGAEVPAEDVSFVWLRGWREVTTPAGGELTVDLSAEGSGAVQYTGFSLQRR